MADRGKTDMSWKSIQTLLSKLWATFILGLILLLLLLAWWSSHAMFAREFPKWVTLLLRHVVQLLFLFAVIATVQVWWQPDFVEKWYARRAGNVELILLVVKIAAFLLLLGMAAVSATYWFR
jgi:hypothetical protein